ncbi:Adenosine monophosphate-protein transferase SoFic [uncultured spirochete]|uniref:Adenosine monophosphate-protein transferase SoFic n=1 Tax=uncultured spirochete TaxID=156406 RepID=A0A3P3XM67_9SPIR|nr:Adenosine monophosphate-protein transferase SoFic [uncultured spirochete]SLM17362.1 Adenosine monophosphate-protein transferase SoFic [uncultured spirochete]
MYQFYKYRYQLLTYVLICRIIGFMSSFNPFQPYNTLPLLPPDLAKTEIIAILKQETNAAAALAELKGLANIIPNQAILINAIVLQEAKDSSEVENIITTRDELYKALSTTIKKYDPATKEVMYYREALNEGFQKVSQRHLISLSDILHLQQTIVKNDAGIRKLPGTALVNDTTEEVIYTPPDGEAILQTLMANFMEYLNNDERSLTKLAILHYQFESIHPFYDGNGRTGRIINILYLLLKEYLDIPILYLSSYIIKNKSMYYKLLHDVTSEGAWEPWILFMLKGIEETSHETLLKIKHIKELLELTIEKVREQASKIYSKELVETLFVNPYCKVEFITKSVGVERKAASRYLHQLADIGVLAVYKVGKENIFINSTLIDILKQ